MDVYYMTDSIQYGSFRNPLYRDYEKFPFGTLENPLNSPPKSSQQQLNQQQQQQQRTAQGGKSKSKSKESCPFCKEQKKRPLGAYLRKRGQRITSESISEDVEECNEEQEEQEESAATVDQGSACNDLHQHHMKHHGGQSPRLVSGGRYSRQESQDSDCGK